ncbi:MAG: gliding motility-associated C-terminal domain-containing protein [Bacteroidota bacterium]
MRLTLLLTLFCLTSLSAIAQGVSCPAVTAVPDTSINCSSPCVQLQATPVSGFETTTYQAQQIPYNPYPYNQGTSVLLNIDDTWSSIIPIPFNFCFYGTSYNQLVIGSNGLVSFDLTQAGGYCPWPINAGIPSNANPTNCIMGPFHDIDPSINGTIRWAVYGSAPCRVFVVSFDDCAMFDCNNLQATQQIVLYETTNVIETYVENKPTCTSWNAGAAIHGIQDAAGNQATVVPGRNFPTQWTVTNDAWAFIPDGVQNYNVRWYEVGNPANTIATTDTVTVCPATSTEYVAEVTYTNCDASTVVVTDTASIVLSGTGSFTVATAATPASCFNSTDGTATATPAGSGPFVYQWSTAPPQTTSTATNLAPGSYSVTVSDTSGCSIVQQVSVGSPPPLVLTTTTTDVLCAGDADGTASVSALGGFGSYTYDWGNALNSATVSGLSGGSYTVTVTDGNNCSATATAIISEPAPLTATAQATDIVCAGGNNGTLEAVPAGGTPPYTYAWPSGPGPQTIAGLSAGTYEVTVTDANGCTTTAQTEIVEPAELVVTIAGTDEICRGEEAPLNAVITGGAAPYSYQWVSIPNSINDTNAAIAPRPFNSSTYVLQITDANGCRRETRYDVTVHDVPIVDFTPSLREGCDTLLVDFANNSQFGATYAWDFGNGSSSPLESPSSTYTTGIFDVRLTVTSPEGCVNSATEFALITVLPTPQASFVSDPDLDRTEFLLVSDPSVTLTQTSVFANFHNWAFSTGDSIYGGDAQYTFPDSGTYTITLASINRFGCLDRESRTIRVLQDPFLWVPNAFTPNGDLLNDEFVVQGLMVTEYEIRIFDRWGKEIFVGQSINDHWDGRFASEPVTEGNYIYRINATLNTGRRVTRSGTVLVVR